MRRYSPLLKTRTERLKHSTARSMNWIQRSKSSMDKSLNYNQQLKPRTEKLKHSMARSWEMTAKIESLIGKIVELQSTVETKNREIEALNGKIS